MKKLTKLFAILAVLAMGSAFLSCSNSSGGGSSDSGNNSDDGSGTSVTVPSELVGTWTGTATVSGLNVDMYVTIIMASNGSYTVKMWMDSSKSGSPWATSTGKLTQASSSQIKGSGKDHTFSGTKITDNKWSIIVLTDEGLTCSGTIQK